MRPSSLLRCTLAALCFGLGWAGPTRAGSPVRVPLSFSTNWTTGAGTSVWVVGSSPELGEWNPIQAKRLVFDGSSSWTGTVALQEGTVVEYKYIQRSSAQSSHCDPGNVTWATGGNQTVSVPTNLPAPYQGKTVYYYSSWTNVFCLYSTNGVDFVDAALQPVGGGRSPGETLYRAQGFADEGNPLEFIMHNGYIDYDNAFAIPGSNYLTDLDVFLLQDGNIYNYWPAGTVSAPRVESRLVNSIYAGIPDRTITIRLPRGYDDHPWKRYPVVYMHDGQNVFSPGGAFGSWDADLAADAEISQGRMRESIVVGIDNTSERLKEYIPPGDNAGFGAGTGDLYTRFLIDNVKPTLDFNYRTLPDEKNTVAIGSSLGGLICSYMGWSTNVFGKIGPMSASFWAAPNHVDDLAATAKQDLRIYMDWGDAEGSSIWIDWDVYAIWLGKGFAVHRDLLQVVGCGDAHNEPAWARRLPGAFRFLLSMADEPNYLAQQEYVPLLHTVNYSAAAGTGTLSFQGLGGFSYVVEVSTDEGGSWFPVATNEPAAHAWPEHDLTLFQTAGATSEFHRVWAVPSP